MTAVRFVVNQLMCAVWRMRGQTEKADLAQGVLDAVGVRELIIVGPRVDAYRTGPDAGKRFVRDATVTLDGSTFVHSRGRWSTRALPEHRALVTTFCESIVALARTEPFQARWAQMAARLGVPNPAPSVSTARTLFRNPGDGPSGPGHLLYEMAGARDEQGRLVPVPDDQRETGDLRYQLITAADGSPLPLVEAARAAYLNQAAAGRRPAEGDVLAKLSLIAASPILEVDGQEVALDDLIAAAAVDLGDDSDANAPSDGDEPEEEWEAELLDETAQV